MKVHYPTVYDDHLAREAMTRYYTQVKGWECKCLDRYSKIDMVARKENGTIIVLELMCNACWTNQFTYPNDCIHIPWRKFKTFYTQTKDVPSLNVNRADRGYLIVRGICDYCDENKNDLWQKYSAVVSAAYVRALLENYTD